MIRSRSRILNSSKPELAPYLIGREAIVLEELPCVPADGLGDYGEQVSKFAVVLGEAVGGPAARGLFHERHLGSLQRAGRSQEGKHLPHGCFLGWRQAERDERRRVQLDVGQARLVPRAAERGRDVLDRLTSVMRKGPREHKLKPESGRRAGGSVLRVEVVDLVSHRSAYHKVLRRGTDELAHQV